uniref:Uncharacterized protein n=1 Tax=Saimiri boliviensis boliviensis TaxID=39432 RepID=A0A2K6USE3_SAIBB
MVQAPSPIHSDVRLLLIKFHSTCHRTTSRQLTELKQAIEYWTVLTNIESLHLLAVLGHVIWTEGAQEFNVVIAVVLGHLLSIGFVRAIDFHFSVETIVEQQIMSHADSVRLHWVALSIIVISNIPVVVVTDFPPGALRLCHLAHLPSLPSVVWIWHFTYFNIYYLVVSEFIPLTLITYVWFKLSDCILV